MKELTLAFENDQRQPHIKLVRQMPLVRYNHNGRKVTIGVGDFVHALSDTDVPYVAKIMEIWETEVKDEAYAKMCWMYRSSDLPNQQQIKAKDNELFLAEHFDLNPMESVIDPVQVLFIEASGEKYLSTICDEEFPGDKITRYVCSREFDATTGELSPLSKERLQWVKNTAAVPSPSSSSSRSGSSRASVSKERQMARSSKSSVTSTEEEEKSTSDDDSEDDIQIISEIKAPSSSSGAKAEDRKTISAASKPTESKREAVEESQELPLKSHGKSDARTTGSKRVSPAQKPEKDVTSTTHTKSASGGQKETTSAPASKKVGGQLKNTSPTRASVGKSQAHQGSGVRKRLEVDETKLEEKVDGTKVPDERVPQTKRSRGTGSDVGERKAQLSHSHDVPAVVPRKNETIKKEEEQNKSRTPSPVGGQPGGDTTKASAVASETIVLGHDNGEKQLEPSGSGSKHAKVGDTNREHQEVSETKMPDANEVSSEQLGRTSAVVTQAAADVSISKTTPDASGTESNSTGLAPSDVSDVALTAATVPSVTPATTHGDDKSLSDPASSPVSIASSLSALPEATAPPPTSSPQPTSTTATAELQKARGAKRENSLPGAKGGSTNNSLKGVHSRIRIGPDYQAAIPPYKGSAPPPMPTASDELVWSPSFSFSEKGPAAEVMTAKLLKPGSVIAVQFADRYASERRLMWARVAQPLDETTHMVKIVPVDSAWSQIPVAPSTGRPLANMVSMEVPRRAVSTPENLLEWVLRSEYERRNMDGVAPSADVRSTFVLSPDQFVPGVDDMYERWTREEYDDYSFALKNLKAGGLLSEIAKEVLSKKPSEVVEMFWAPRRGVGCWPIGTFACSSCKSSFKPIVACSRFFECQTAVCSSCFSIAKHCSRVIESDREREGLPAFEWVKYSHWFCKRCVKKRTAKEYRRPASALASVTNGPAENRESSPPLPPAASTDDASVLLAGLIPPPGQEPDTETGLAAAGPIARRSVALPVNDATGSVATHQASATTAVEVPESKLTAPDRTAPPNRTASSSTITASDVDVASDVESVARSVLASQLATAPVAQQPYLGTSASVSTGAVPGSILSVPRDLTARVNMHPATLLMMTEVFIEYEKGLVNPKVALDRLKELLIQEQESIAREALAMLDSLKRTRTTVGETEDRALGAVKRSRSVDN